MKLLIITGDKSKRLNPHIHYLFDELAHITDLTLWYEPGNIHDILKKIPENPDFILINEHGEKNCPKITGLSTLTIPYGVYVHDVHYNIKQRRIEMVKDKVQYIFSIYRDPFYRWYPAFKQKMKWLPHHVNPKLYRDYGLKKEIDFLLMGAVNQQMYPLRCKILKTMKKKPTFVYHPHPGYRDYEEHEKNRYFIGEKYAREINRAKMFFTCDLSYKYPVKKYYEVLASNTLLLAPASQELKDLGFIPGVHFVAINEHDFEQKAEYYLRHEEERRNIAEQGYRMVHEKHTTAIRARQLVEMIQDLLVNHKPTEAQSSNVNRRRANSENIHAVGRKRKNLRAKRATVNSRKRRYK
ncbi:glycosyltransferase [Brevibacillus sp. H7]|uniref:glycosyltransferase n=1 Tax=Brevibacillus sp. H7 TaxID=3349138 RepID=UPI0038075731